METVIREAVAKILVALGAEHVTFAVEWPQDLAHGDFAVNAALAAAKALGKNPRELAEEIAAELALALGDAVRGIEVAGPGFINIFLHRTVFTSILEAASHEDWGRGTAHKDERIAFEYSCPNAFKEMHAGHLMSTTLGEASSRLIENQGARVIRDTYGGDVGPHVAKALWGLKKQDIFEPATAKEIGIAYAKGSRAYEESDTAKEEIESLNTRLYTLLGKEAAEWSEEERELHELWRKGRDVSFAAFAEVWNVLDTHFDYVIHESETTPLGKEKVLEGLANGVFSESQGAVIYEGEKKGLHTLVFLTSRGNPTYEAKDIGLAYLKEERMSPLHRVYIMTAAEQTGHFAVFLAALEDIAPALAHKTAHIAHGFLKLTTGKMSSREGNVLGAADLIEEVTAKASEKNEDPLVAQQVAVAAIKYMILRQAPGGDIVFDPEKSLSLEGDSGPYLQYAYVRARSILLSKPAPESTEEVPPEPYVLERLLLRFPGVLARAEEERAPQAVAQYLTHIAGEWNSFYAQNRILDGEYEAYKLLLVQAFMRTMQKGLWVLGIPAPEKM